MSWNSGTAVVLFLMIICVIGSYFSVAHAKLMPKSQDASNKEAARMLRKLWGIAGKADEANGSPSLTLREYQELVFNPPRNYTVFVLFHNDDSICDSCYLVRQTFEKIGKSFWRGFTKYDETNDVRNLQAPIFFVTVNMMEGYRQMFLDLDPSKPSLYWFTPSTSSKYNQFDQAETSIMELDYGGYNLDKMLAWIQDRVGFLIPIEAQDSSSRGSYNLILWTLCGLISLYNIYYFGYLELFMEALTQANYAYGISVAILWLISGQMYNYIRYTPFMGSGGIRLTSLIYPGSRYQYGTESIIIMIIYAVIMYSFIKLIENRERQLSEGLSVTDIFPKVIGALTGVFLGFLVLQIITQMKGGG